MQTEGSVLNSEGIHINIENGILIRYIGKETEIVIPDTVTEIGDRALVRYTHLTSVVIPDSVIKIGGGAFIGCTNLVSVTIPSSVTKVGFAAFIGCKSLDQATKDRLLELGYNDF